jgi:hypothetical protein
MRDRSLLGRAVHDGALIAGEFRQLGRGHAEALVPMIAALPVRGAPMPSSPALARAAYRRAHRAGCRAALALAWGAGFGLPHTGADRRHGARWSRREVLAATTGGHGEWFVQGFGADGAALAPLASLTPQAAAAK